MSYILDALANAERAREGDGRVPLKFSTDEPRQLRPSLLRQYHWLLAALLAGTAIGAVVMSSLRIFAMPSHAEPTADAARTAPAAAAVIATAPVSASSRPSPRASRAAAAKRPSKRPADDVMKDAGAGASAAPPSGAQDAMPSIAIGAQIYSESPQHRMANVNGRIVREGAKIAPDLVLERITPDGIILEYRGRQIFRSAAAEPAH